MSGLSDTPFLGSIVDRISGEATDAFFRGLRYSFGYRGLVKDLSFRIEEVVIQEVRVANMVAAEKNNGKIIEDHVLEWHKKVEDIKAFAEELSRQRPSCFGVLPNPVYGFRLSRKAAHMAKNVAELTVSAEDICANKIAYYPSKEYVPISDNAYQKIGCRKEAYGKLWEALVKEDGHPILSIYGMPGVGKTVMMEQACQEAREKMIFDKVTRADVGSEIDVIKLQDQLAGYLDCQLQSHHNKSLRASQLENRLINGGKILILLDNVWDIMPLKDIGIPYGDGSSKGCKILLTCRREDVCFLNNSIDPIEIKTLPEDDTCEMFENTVGTSKIASLQDAALAKKVCKECAGLPLLIRAVGEALKFASENSWKDALYQLENDRLKEIAGMKPQVYSCLHMSLNKLKDAEKTCLLLCSVFQEDADIEIKKLFDLAKGSELIDSGRNKHELTDILKSSSLLIQGKDDYTVNMNHIIRDVGRYIAARDPKYAFIYIKCSSWMPDIGDSFTPKLLHLDLEGQNVRFPDDQVYPDLHTLWLRCNKQSQKHLGGFFNVLTNLRFLMLKEVTFSQQHVYIGRLVNLRVLILDGCDVHQTFLSSISNNLEILRIWECHLPVPLGLPEMKDLRKLELLSDQSQTQMLPKVILSLLGIEVKIPGRYKAGDYAATSIFCSANLGCELVVGY